MRYASLPSVAVRLYRLAVEKQKPDEEREPGFQVRDLKRFRQSLQALSRRYDESVDKALLGYLLQRYAELPAGDRMKSMDDFFQIGDRLDPEQRKRLVDDAYSESSLADQEVRLAWMDKSVEEFQNSDDPFIQYAVASHDERMAFEEADKELRGQFQRWRPQYMEAVIAYNRSLGQPIYADANGSLRVTFGQVGGNQPKDGLINQPFTTLEGILEKDTGEDPFNLAWLDNSI